MSKSTSFDTYEAADDILDDPFAALGTRYVKKTELRDNKTAFEIIAVEGPQVGQFGDEVVITIEYVSHLTGELTQGKVSFPTLNAKKVISPRSTALLQMQVGLERGKRYADYYLVGAGQGFLISKTPQK
jgi:hypothetical protein